MGLYIKRHTGIRASCALWTEPPKLELFPQWAGKQKNSQRHKPLGVFKHGYFVCFGQTADTIYLHYTGMDQKLQEGKYRIGCHGAGKLLLFVHTHGIIVSISLRNCFEQFTVNSVARCLKACWLLGTFCFSDMQRRYKGVAGTKLASVLLRHSPNCVSDRTAVWLRRAKSSTSAISTHKVRLRQSPGKRLQALRVHRPYTPPLLRHSQKTEYRSGGYTRKKPRPH